MNLNLFFQFVFCLFFDEKKKKTEKTPENITIRIHLEMRPNYLQTIKIKFIS